MEFELHGFLSSFLLYHLARRDKQDTLIENRMELKAVSVTFLCSNLQKFQFHISR